MTGPGQHSGNERGRCEPPPAKPGDIVGQPYEVSHPHGTDRRPTARSTGHHSAAGRHHSHGSRLTLTGEHRQSLVVVMLITLTVAVAEAIGAWVSGALVLLADAAHMAADAAGVGLSLLAVMFAMRPATAKRTFGYARAEILAAVINAVVLFGMSVFILVQSVSRLVMPSTATAAPLLAWFGAVA